MNIFKDTRLSHIDQHTVLDLPKWLKTNSYAAAIKSLRQVLGMTQGQLAKRSGLHPRQIPNLESESKTDPQLSTLRKIASGLGCELVVKFVPKKSLKQILSDQCEKIATETMRISSGSSALETQASNRALTKELKKQFTKQLLTKKSSLWDR